jgi:hypothetical protein
LEVANHGLGVRFDMDVLDPHVLGSTSTHPAQRFDLNGIGPQKFAGCRSIIATWRSPPILERTGASIASD